jgi:hypothetical protein
MSEQTTVDNKVESSSKPDIEVKVLASEQARSVPNHWLALLLLGAALAVIFATGGYWWWKGTSPGYTGGGAAAAVGILLILALLVECPTLIKDDTEAAGGEPSTMRILTLAIVLTFCILLLRTGWNQGTLPSLEGQSNWVWLVTAALGGKALQKFAEVQEKTTKK